MKKIFIIIGCCVFLIVASIAGYFYFTQKNKPEVVKILVPYSTSNTTAYDSYRAIMLAHSVYAPKSKYTIELVPIDISNTEHSDQFDDTEKAPLIFAYLDDPAAVASIGPLTSPMNIAILPMMNQANISIIGFAASYSGLTIPDYADKNEYERLFPSGKQTYFSVIPNSDDEARTAIEYLWRHGANSLLLVTDGLAFGEGVMKSVTTYAHAKNIPIYYSSLQEFSNTDKEVNSILTQNKPDAVLYGGFGSPLLYQFIQNLRSTGYTGPIMGSNFTSTIENPQSFSGDSNIFSTDPLPPYDVLTSTEARRFLQGFIEKYGRPPTTSAALAAYEATRLAIETIKLSGPDREKFRKALATTRSFNTAYGLIRFDEHGNDINIPGSISRLVNGKWVYEQETQ